MQNVQIKNKISLDNTKHMQTVKQQADRKPPFQAQADRKHTCHQICEMFEY